MRKTDLFWLLAAGTYDPICARIAINAFWRKKVDFPDIFGPVSSHMLAPSLIADKLHEFETNGVFPVLLIEVSTTGCLPETILKSLDWSSFGSTHSESLARYPRLQNTSISAKVDAKYVRGTMRDKTEPLSVSKISFSRLLIAPVAFNSFVSRFESSIVVNLTELAVV